MKKFIFRVLPKTLQKHITHIRKQVRNFKILAVDYGQFKTIKKWSCEDKEGNPIPWYTYPAIEYLKHLDFSCCSVFEFGSGNSTLFWLKRAKRVVSIENNKEWYEKTKTVSRQNFSNYEYHLLENESDYVSIINRYHEFFDVIVIDGVWRGSCAKVVVEHVRKWGGQIVLFDNSDWYPNTIDFLRKELNWIEVDFHGFGPINDYTLTTTLFLSRSFSSKLFAKNVLRSLSGISQSGGDDLTT